MIFAARISVRILFFGIVVTTIAVNAGAQARPRLSSASRFWKPVEDALGRKGTPNPGDVLKFGFPRGTCMLSSVE